MHYNIINIIIGTTIHTNTCAFIVYGADTYYLSTIVFLLFNH